MTGMVSVIIPVYNAEKYLIRCVDSVLSQTYKNIEVILADDGSTDSSPKICDSFGEKDRRVVVIHQKNSGVSVARNASLKAAKGEYLAFMDSDDLAERDMLELMVEKIESAGADMAFCAHYVDIEGTSKRKIIASQDCVMDRESFIKFLIDGKGNDFLWNKLYRRSLWKDIYFPEGEIYEDIAVMNQLIKRCGKVVYFGKPLYHYIQRAGSLTRSRATVRLFDGIKQRKERYEYVKKSCPALERPAKKQLVYFILWAEYLIKRSSDVDEELIKREPELKAMLKDYGNGVGAVLGLASKTALYTPFLYTAASKILSVFDVK